MPRIEDLIPRQSLRFSDDYDVYVDYGKGKPVKMNNDESIFRDVEKFLLGRTDQSKNTNYKKTSRSKPSTKSKLITYDERSLFSYHSTNKPNRSLTYHRYNEDDIIPEIHSTFTPHHSRQNSSSLQKGSTIIYDETWSSNKHYNSRVAAFIDQIDEKFHTETDEISPRYKTSRACTYQVSTGQAIQERIYPGRLEKELSLRMAVNGASKSMRGEVPMSNLNLLSGDFGDDAGIFMENRGFCFVGLADGAGGNRSLGINPADFSRAILAACRSMINKKKLQSNQLPQLITSALQQVQASKIRGSSTLCVLALNKQEHTLTSLNIGDSGYVIYRNNKIYCRSTCTINVDGCGPRQLFALNGSLGSPCPINENEILEDCSLDNIKVRKNDIIILSSDGLWDVIEADQLQKIIERNTNNNLQNIADDLLNLAVDGYTVNSRDDILIIVCQVVES